MTLHGIEGQGQKVNEPGGGVDGLTRLKLNGSMDRVQVGHKLNLSTGRTRRR